MLLAATGHKKVIAETVRNSTDIMRAGFRIERESDPILLQVSCRLCLRHRRVVVSASKSSWLAWIMPAYCRARISPKSSGFEV